MDISVFLRKLLLRKGIYFTDEVVIMRQEAFLYLARQFKEVDSKVFNAIATFLKSSSGKEFARKLNEIKYGNQAKRFNEIKFR